MNHSLTMLSNFTKNPLSIGTLNKLLSSDLTNIRPSKSNPVFLIWSNWVSVVLYLDSTIIWYVLIDKINHLDFLEYDIVFDYPNMDGWCHLTGKTEEILHEFCEKIGRKRCWFHKKYNRPHYDVREDWAQKIINAGGMRIQRKQTVIYLKHHYGEIGKKKVIIKKKNHNLERKDR